MDKEKELFNTALGKRVKEARRAAGLKGKEAAEMAGITAQFLSEVERGKKGITSYNLAPLARALRVTSDFLLFGWRDVDERVPLIAEHLTALPPAQCDMAIEVLEYALAIIRKNLPD